MPENWVSGPVMRDTKGQVGDGWREEEKALESCSSLRDFLPVLARGLGGEWVGLLKNLHLTLVPFKALKPLIPGRSGPHLLLLSSKTSCFRSQPVRVPGPPRNLPHSGLEKLPPQPPSLVALVTSSSSSWIVCTCPFYTPG